MNTQYDPVNNPQHYNTHAVLRYECIDYARSMSFPAGNAFKYLYRYLDKGNPAQDIRKAIYYLQCVEPYPILKHDASIANSLEEDIEKWKSENIARIDGGINYYEMIIYDTMINLYSTLDMEQLEKHIPILEKYATILDS